MIKNKNDLKNIQIVCRNQEQVKNCFKMLKELGFDVEDFTKYCDGWNIIYWEKNQFIFSAVLNRYFIIELYNKKFVKTLQKFINEKEEEEKVKDFEVASDGRIIKVNNYKSEKEVFSRSSMEGGDKIKVLHPDWLDHIVEQGLAYTTQEAKDRAMFKSKIETKLKNIAERLNAGRKIDWENALPYKYFIYYIQSKENQSEEKILLGYDFKFKRQGAIYCLDENFLEVAKQEIGEENLIKYFTES